MHGLLRQFPQEEPCPLVEVPADPPKICQLWSNSQAFSTKPSNVGCGKSVRSFCCRAVGRLRQKAHILVVSSTPVRLASLLHSWNQVAKSRVPICLECILEIASICDAGGMNCFLKASLNSSHVP